MAQSVASPTIFKGAWERYKGLGCREIQYGLVSANYDNIYVYLEYEQIISSQFLKLSNGSAREVFVSDADFDKMLFSDEEKNTISTITEKFANISSMGYCRIKPPGESMEKPEGSKQLIKYQDYAFELTAL